MTLWRKFNDVEDLIGIVRMMDFLQEVRVGQYNAPFSHKHYPIHVQSFDDWLTEMKKQHGITDDNIIDNGESITNRVSNFVYQNCPYNAAGGGHNVQFNKAREAYYYYKRLSENYDS